VMGNTRTGSSSPEACHERREIDGVQRETLHRLLWLASLWVFPSEEQYARIFPDEPWLSSDAGRADRRAGESTRAVVEQAGPRSRGL
jgi:hypothetical protein